MSRRPVAVALLAVAALVLTACAGLPTSGDVQEGRTVGGDSGSRDIAFLPARPQPGATPEQIVDGFLRAASGPGTAGDWPRAKEFLSSSFSGSWDPRAGVTVDRAGERIVRLVDEDTVAVTISPVAIVDERGSYESTDAGATPLTFDLVRGDDDEWRISSAPNGVVLDTSVFRTVFQEYPLMYFDPTWEYLVPDVRWFPTTNAATRITDALVNEPRSEWLDRSIATAFPEGVSAGVSVPVASQVATVPLSDDALLVDQTTRDRMQTQLEASLRAAQVTEVEMVVASSVLEASTVATRRTAVTGAPLVQSEEGFGFLTGGELAGVPGLSGSLGDLDIRAVQISADRSTAVVRLAAGGVARVLAGDAPVVLDDRPGLVDPTIDPEGIVWTVPRDAPQAVESHLPDGRTIAVAGAWPEASQITAMAVSREGTRMAALVTSGGRVMVWVAGIVRGADDVPTLGVPRVLGQVAGNGIGLAWLDDTTVGVLSGGEDGTTVLSQLVGGPGSTTIGPVDATAIASGASGGTIRLRGDAGTLYVRRGTNWQVSTSGILVLATQQGPPD